MLKSCGVTDGCTIQVASRMRGGGRSKNKAAAERKKKSPKRVEQDDQNTKEENLPEDAIAEMFDRGSRTGVGGLCAEMMEAMVGMEDVQMEKMSAEEVGGDPEVAVRGIRKFVREQRQRKKEQRRREEPLEEMRTESTDEPEVTGKFADVKTGRGSASLVRGEVDSHDKLDETRGKGKGKENGGKGEHGGKGDMGGKGIQQSAKKMKGEEELRSEENETQKELMDEEEQEEDEEDDRVQVAPNTGAGGSHPRATTDPKDEGQEEEVEEAGERQCGGGKRSQAGEWTLGPAREWQKWADCVDEEPEEEAGEEDEQEAEDERGENKAEELSRRTEEAGGGSSEEHVTEEEAEERESRGSKGREEEVKGEEEEAGRGEDIGEKPPGLEEVKSKLEAREEEKQNQAKSEREAQEEEKRSQVEREQEVQKAKRREDEGRGEEGKTGEEEGRTQEARSEEKRGETRRSEEKRVSARRSEEGAKEERREARMQEAREKEVEAQEEQRREEGREERRNKERDVEPQGGQGGEERVDAQGGRERKEGETNDENSLHEESHASDRYLTWWRNAWWVRVNNGPHMRTARGRRRIWRAARQAAEQVCQEERAGEAQGREEREGGGARKERQQQQERQQRQQRIAVEIVFLPEHGVDPTGTYHGDSNIQFERISVHRPRWLPRVRRDFHEPRARNHGQHPCGTVWTVVQAKRFCVWTDWCGQQLSERDITPRAQSSSTLCWTW